MMPAFRLAIALLVLTSSVLAQDQAPAKNDAAPVPSQTTSPNPQAPATNSGPAVDAATVNGSTFESQYFKFTYELPAGWKALDDAVRMKSNREVLQQDAESAKRVVSSPKKTSTKTAPKSTNNLPAVSPVIERYSLMAASPNGIDNLASPVLPRINIWAHHRVPPFDSPMDNARLAVNGKRSSVLVKPHEITFNGQTYARVQLITPGGEYQSRYITVIGDYLVGFDFWAQSEREMVELSETIKSVRLK